MARRGALAVLAVVLGLAVLVADAAPTLHAVVLAGQPAPGGGVFDRFGVESLPMVAPVNARGHVAFFATLARGPAGEGYYLASPAGIAKVAAEGDAAPGGGSFSGFGRHPIPALNDAGAVAFVAAVSGGRTVEGLFVAAGGRTRAVALAGGPAPGIPSGTLAGLDAPALNNQGDVVFLASVRRGRESVEAIYLYGHRERRVRKIVAQGDPAPSGGAFAGFGVPALNDRGTVVFAAVLEGRAATGGLFVSERGTARLVVAAGDEAPGGGIFAKFSERVAVNDTGVLAFNAVLKHGPTEAGVFVVDQGAAHRV
ncbi:MAG TPA: choice-of-anchor tandem repeat NxxGxxAF-containing protein, partial [Methylomirabilota bacterium]|nr:choice-of-anchor tandem repeat NxxGxxAF-containing protein [Methylomirabilota bacterium]